MSPNIMDRSVADVLGEALDAQGESQFVIAPDALTIEALVDMLDEGAPPVRLLSDSETLNTVLDDFLVAGQAADHIEAGTLDVRVGEERANTLLLTDGTVVSIVRGDENVAGLTSDDERFTESVRERYETVWKEAEPYSLRTPALTRVHETLETELGEETAEDFDAILSSLEGINGDRAELDEVTISLLIAAKNEELLYDISKWGEDVGIASKATFSRTKTRMEDAGVITTEKVPIEVGRPRLRLKLADDRLRNVTVDELLEVTRSMLTA